MEVSSSTKPINTTSTSPIGMEQRKGGGGSSTSLRSFDFIVLRLLAFITTLVAVILMGISEQTKMVPFVILPNLPPLTVEATAQWQHLSAFRPHKSVLLKIWSLISAELNYGKKLDPILPFFLASNIIACIYAALSLILSIVVRSSSKCFGSMIFILDLVVVNLLFSGIGAAAAVGLIGYQGNSYVLWKKVCNVFGSFCRYNAVATVMSLLGSMMFVLILVLIISKLHNNRSRC